MSILERLIEVRAMKALIKKLYYDVAPVVISGNTLTIFYNDCDIDSFCRENKIDIRAMNWLIEAMCNENLLMRGKMSIIFIFLSCKITKTINYFYYYLVLYFHYVLFTKKRRGRYFLFFR